MKKIFIYILLVLSIFLISCGSSDEKEQYETIYNSEGYELSSFNLSDIKIKVSRGDDVTYVPVTSDMLDNDYAFDKAGKYLVEVRYEDWYENIIIIITDSNATNTGDNGDSSGNEGDNGGGTITPPVTNGYKEITEKYTAFSGAALADRVGLDTIGTTLYVGNTFGLDNEHEYTSSDPSVIRINDNNVLICLKKGKATISAGDELRVKISVEEMELSSENYYSTIGFLPEMNSDDIKSILHNLIDEHVSGSYALLKTILPLSDADPNNSSNMILLYTGRSQGGPITQNNGDDDWNREHVWPLSRMGTMGNTNSIAGHDAHHIRPADVSVNKDRGNLQFGVATTIEEDKYAEGSTKCKISSYYFEPRDEVKGDIARMLFYMAVRYEGDVSGEVDLELVFDLLASNDCEMGNLALLLEWNRIDPVDEFEMNRNNVIYTYQNNRNPFIDYPSLADLIWSQSE